MWYEILPVLGILVGATGFTAIGNYAVNRLVLGNAFKRDMCETYDVLYYIRDTRLTGDAYKQQGLEAIPDED